MKTYNKSEILKMAWKLVRRNGFKLSEAMKTAWQYARNAVAASAQSFVYKGDAERVLHSPIRRYNGSGLCSLQATINRGI
jgi:hypothetical protein